MVFITDVTTDRSVTHVSSLLTLNELFADVLQSVTAAGRSAKVNKDASFMHSSLYSECRRE